jgi:hypothetical protein
MLAPVRLPQCIAIHHHRAVAENGFLPYRRVIAALKAPIGAYLVAA